MSDRNENQLEIDLVLKEQKVDETLNSVESKAKKAAEKIKLFDFDEMKKEGESTLLDMAGRFGSLGVAVAGAGVAVYAIKKALDFAIQGERIQAINAQFDQLASYAGLVPSELRAGFLDAGQGMIGLEKILQSSTTALLNLGKNAEKLPRLLELARRITDTMGGNIEERYATLISAVDSANAKTLRSQGIFLDVDKVMTDYAETLGLAASELNQSQKQQAILNATLDQGSSRFKETNASIQPLADNSRRVGEGFSTIVDNMKKGITNSGIYQAALEGLANKLEDFNRGQPVIRNGLATEVASLVAQRMRLEQDIAKLVKYPGINPDHSKEVIKEMKAQIIDINKEIAKSGAIVRSNTAVMVQEAAKAQAEAKKKKEAEEAALDAKQKALVISRRLATEEAKLQGERTGNNIEVAKTALLKSDADRRLALLEAYKSRAELITREQALKEKQIFAERQAGTIQTEEQYQARLYQIRNQYSEMAALLEIDRQKAVMEYTATAQEGITGFETTFAAFSETIDGAKMAAKDFAFEAAANFRNLGKQMFNAVGNAAGQAFASFGQAIATGQNALEAFVNSLLASMGQMAVQLGTQFILQGLAYSWAGMANGPALIAAGAALAAFGGLLSGLGGAGASSSGGGSSGSESNSQTPATNAIAPEKRERQEPDTKVSVIVQGDVFDSDATGMRIANILTSEYKKSGVKIVGYA